MTRAAIERAAIPAALLALFVWSAWHRYAFLSTSPYPMGVDGYFYADQLRSLLDGGTLHYPSSPLSFYLMAPFAAIMGPIAGAKLGAAIGGALVVVPAFLVGKRFGGRGTGCVASALAVTSAGSFYLSIEFVKNGWGLTAALFAVWLVLRAIDDTNQRTSIAAIAGMVAAALTHKMAFGFAMAITAPAIVVALVKRSAISRQIVIGAGITAVAVVVIGLVLPERFLAGRDVALLGDLFSSTSRWDAPALVIPGLTLAMGHGAMIGGLLALIVVPLEIWWPGERGRRPEVFAIAALALAIALPRLDVEDPQGLAFRLRIAAFVPMALLAAVLAGRVVAFAKEPALAFGVAAIAVIAAPLAYRDGVVRSHPAMIAAVLAIDGALPDDTILVVTERHTGYAAAYHTRYPITLDPARAPVGRRVRLLPRRFIGAGSPLYKALLLARDTPGVAPPIGFHPRDPNGLVAVPEPTWAWALSQIPPDHRLHFESWPTI
jgi:hypothetical protein